MNAGQLDASRRITDVKRMIAHQTLLKSELRMKGLPVDKAEDLIDILQCCLVVIESSQTTNEEDAPPPPPSMVA